MAFENFLEKLAGDDKLYLTTQYEEQPPQGNDLDDDDDFKKDDSDGLIRLKDFCPEPTGHLVNDFPLSPAILGNLIPQQVNLWIGRSSDGYSSGLHHDYHDNLYVLLKGRKRFTLFAPTDAHFLYTYGQIDQVHSNGLISYKGRETRADGLKQCDVAEWKVERLQEELSFLDDDNEEDRDKIKDLEKKLDEATKQLESSFAEEEVSSDDGHGPKPLLKSNSSPAAPEPPSFSKIPVSALRTGHPSDEFPAMTKARPYQCEIEAGMMLYLPASWFHEVTSFSDSTEDVHMAFNYWMHPPDVPSNYDRPYGEGYELLKEYYISMAKIVKQTRKKSMKSNSNSKRKSSGSGSKPAAKGSDKNGKKTKRSKGK